MKTYTTAQGDMWDSIAHVQLGDAAYMDKLIQANLAYREYYIFPAGIVVSSQVKRAKFGQKVYQCRVEVSPGSIPAEKVSL